jgi:hypothetical protein
MLKTHTNILGRRKLFLDFLVSASVLLGPCFKLGLIKLGSSTSVCQVPVSLLSSQHHLNIIGPNFNLLAV